MLTSLEVCAGAGGQALGLEMAGFQHLLLLELDAHGCRTLKINRPEWPVVRADIRRFPAHHLRGRVDLLAGGVPCPPFSVAGKRLGNGDERDLFPELVRLARECSPRAVFIENVPGLLERRFTDYRESLKKRFRRLGYSFVEWEKLQASDFGVPQLRPRAVMVALRSEDAGAFEWPKPSDELPPTVGEALLDLMSEGGWRDSVRWARDANEIAPTLVGGSLKHGGPDLGPTRAKRQWREMGVDGLGLANEPPPPDFAGLPRLTVDMCAVLQGFPRSWVFTGRKTNTYRQVGNAFPPPVAAAVGRAVHLALTP